MKLFKLHMVQVIVMLCHNSPYITVTGHHITSKNMHFLIFYYIPITFPSHLNRSFTTFLVGFLLKELYVFQEHLTAVILEKTQSPYHILFTKAKKTRRERSAVILQGFEPIEDDDNVSYTFISSYFGTSLAPPCKQSALSNR